MSGARHARFGKYLTSHYTVKLINRIENRFPKRRRHKMLGFGRPGATPETLKKVAKTSYDTAWEFADGAMQGGLGHATRDFEGI